jgi:hypothetical protein
MEPITLIVTALAAGAAAGMQDVAGEAVRNAYQSLKDAILRHFGDRPEVSVALTKAEAKPEVWAEPLKDALQEAGADQEPEIVEAAQEVMKVAEPAAASAGKYNVTIHGNVQGLAQGDHQHVEMTFRTDQ